MTKTAAIPLSSNPPGKGTGVGTGFIARRAGQPWLVTAAHVPTHTQPTQDWSVWPAEMILHVSGQSVGLPLFDIVAGARVPKFARAIDPVKNTLSDVIALPILESAVAEGGPLSNFIVFDCPATPDLNFGDKVYGFGYPPRPYGGWPYTPADMWLGDFLSRDGDVIKVLGTCIGGHSGGPVFSPKGWVGMCIGSTAQPDGLEPIYVVPADYICNLLVGTPTST